MADYNSLNKVNLIGFVASDVETGTTKDVKRKWSLFQLATFELFYKRGKKTKPHAEYHTIMAWGSLSTISEKYLKKNMRVSIEGKLRKKTFTKDGKKIHRIQVEAEKITFMTKDSPLKPSEEEEDEKINKEGDPF
jgi:single-strand DNA-binding protein